MAATYTCDQCGKVLPDLTKTYGVRIELPDITEPGSEMRVGWRQALMFCTQGCVRAYISSWTDFGGRQ
ncbi:hypothetical protein SEA_ZITCH_83 [Gordonia Phage Zitch]|uniref:Uncharacterized protein n=1 Tax=Gordonia Phage Zitch TaxID=2743909 RepID=A0A7G3V9V3_9CAUD|nr:hypothetical protein J1774_gp83 [Gordonia Phage Zitch]QKY78528.1 hypothetical protein SEA_ZITCH_83 [Gordonia Phage Zitch]